MLYVEAKTIEISGHRSLLNTFFKGKIFPTLFVNIFQGKRVCDILLFLIFSPKNFRKVTPLQTLYELIRTMSFDTYVTAVCATLRSGARESLFRFPKLGEWDRANKPV